MIDLGRYPDETLLSTSEIRAWIGLGSNKAVLRLPIEPRFRGREFHFLAGDVKRALLGDAGPTDRVDAGIAGGGMTDALRLIRPELARQ